MIVIDLVRIQSSQNHGRRSTRGGKQRKRKVVIEKFTVETSFPTYSVLHLVMPYMDANMLVRVPNGNGDI
jgi:hypothetical protein